MEHIDQLCYCKKCGRVVREIRYEDEKRRICDVCHSRPIYPVPEEYDWGGLGYGINPELEEEFMEKYVKNSPEFDQDLFERRPEILHQNYLEDKAIRESGRALIEAEERAATCPFCGSKKTAPISGLSRAISVGFLGLASGKIGKNRKCNNCGAMW